MRVNSEVERFIALLVGYPFEFDAPGTLILDWYLAFGRELVKVILVSPVREVANAGPGLLIFNLLRSCLCRHRRGGRPSGAEG